MLHIFVVTFLLGITDGFTTYHPIKPKSIVGNKEWNSKIFLLADEYIQTSPSSIIKPTDESLPLHNSTAILNDTTTTNSWLSQSVLLLNLVAILWGTQHAVIKLVVDDSDVAAWSLTRFGLAALLAAPFTPGLVSLKKESTDHNNSTTTATTWRWGAEMGLYMFLGYAFQAIGLESTTAQRSGFLLYLNVKFVPFLARILLGRSISIPTWISAFTAFVGTALLSWDGSHPSFNVGDVWSIAAALASAMFILRLERASNVVQDSAALNSATLWIVTLLSFVWCTLHSVLNSSPPVSNFDHVWSSPYSQFVLAIQQISDSVMHTIHQHPWELVYLGAIATALTNYIQNKAQRGISAERAAVIYAMDPVYGAITSYFVLGEQLNVYGLLGALLITIAAVVNTSMDFTAPSKEVTKNQL